MKCGLSNAFTLAATALVACVICYSVGYQRRAEQSPFPTTPNANALNDLRGESGSAALSSIQANVLRPNPNPVVMGGLVKH
jgi:hypothetical protein